MQGILKVTISKILTIKFQNNTTQKKPSNRCKENLLTSKYKTTQTIPSLKKKTHDSTTHRQQIGH